MGYFLRFSHISIVVFCSTTNPLKKRAIDPKMAYIDMREMDVRDLIKNPSKVYYRFVCQYSCFLQCCLLLLSWVSHERLFMLFFTQYKWLYALLDQVVCCTHKSSIIARITFTYLSKIWTTLAVFHSVRALHWGREAWNESVRAECRAFSTKHLEFCLDLLICAP